VRCYLFGWFLGRAHNLGSNVKVKSSSSSSSSSLGTLPTPLRAAFRSGRGGDIYPGPPLRVTILERH
jgi:hypothetical protein